MSAAELNRMLEDGLVRESSWAAVARLDEAFLAGFDLTSEELRVLQMPDPGSLASIGAHPMLAMWGSFMRNHGFAQQMSAAEYFSETNGEV